VFWLCHQIRLVLVAEQELIRVHGQQKAATQPISACAVLMMERSVTYCLDSDVFDSGVRHRVCSVDEVKKKFERLKVSFLLCFVVCRLFEKYQTTEKIECH
jgi:hypothetical protein